MKNIRVCYFGSFDQEYSRNRVIKDGLEQNGVEILFCHEPVSSGLKKYWRLFKKHKAVKDGYDVMIVGYSNSRLIVPFAKILSDKKVIWDAFYSLYDSWVFDRKLAKPGSLKAGGYWFLDWIAARSADAILLDTNEHIDYFSKEFGIKREKFKRIFIGARDDIFYPRAKREGGGFKVLFYGYFIPLQGIQYILEAAKILERSDVNFLIIGSGKESKKMIGLFSQMGIENTEFINKILPSEVIVSRIAEADLCLGIFGDTPKTKRVIPNKVYECVAMRKPVVTGDTIAIRELFDSEDMMLVPVADPKAIANAILALKKDSELREKISKNGYTKFKENTTPQILGLEVKKFINEIQKI